MNEPMIEFTHKAGFIQNIGVDRNRGCLDGGEACACPTGKCTDGSDTDL